MLGRDLKLLPGLRENEGSNRLGLFLLRPQGCLPPWLLHICYRLGMWAHSHIHTHSTRKDVESPEIGPGNTWID